MDKSPCYTSIASSAIRRSNSLQPFPRLCLKLLTAIVFNCVGLVVTFTAHSYEASCTSSAVSLCTVTINISTYLLLPTTSYDTSWRTWCMPVLYYSHSPRRLYRTQPVLRTKPVYLRRADICGLQLSICECDNYRLQPV